MYLCQNTLTMKKTFLLVTLFYIFSASQAIASTKPLQNSISATDERILYIGRTEQDLEKGQVSFDWSATTLRLRFKGSCLQIKCSDNKKDYLNLWIDKPQSASHDKVIEVKGDTLITLFKGKKGVHEVILQKRTEGEQGCVTISNFFTDGFFLEAPTAKPRLIEFVGDSYTCGYGTEAPSADSPFKAEEENPSLTYADIIARFYDAEAVHISHSGRGIVRNYDDYNQHENMVKLYAQTFDQYKGDAWAPTYKPDLVVVYLGTNDFSTGKQPALWAWCESYKNLLLKIREFHGADIPIICMASKADETMGQWVKTAVDRSGLGGVSVVVIGPQGHNNDSDLGASWHPNYRGHRKVASVLAPYISTVMGWEMPFKVLE